jgi:DNA-binding LytR/AlgR family response regulator
MTPTITALIADDEPMLARALQRALGTAWPDLHVVATEHDGAAAIASALSLQPQVLFLDIQMPVANGLEVAAAVADDWPSDAPLPLLVFVTAFDQHAIAAFDHAAVDYVLKPINPERVAKMVLRVQERLNLTHNMRVLPSDAAQAVHQAQSIETARASSADSHASGPDADPLEKIRVLRVAVGNNVRMVPLQDVIAIEATDKYATVVTETGDALVRISLRELMARMDGVAFMQIHRGALVATDRIQVAQRDEAGHYWLQLRGCKRPFKVSRAFSHLFKPM